jgi:hypothetical protein
VDLRKFFGKGEGVLVSTSSRARNSSFVEMGHAVKGDFRSGSPPVIANLSTGECLQFKGNEKREMSELKPECGGRVSKVTKLSKRLEYTIS